MNKVPFQAGSPESLRDDDFRFVREMTKTHSAISLDESKRYLVHSRLLPLARDGGFSSVPAFISDLRLRPFGDAHVRTIEALATSETSFFRDLHPFDALKDDIIPALMRERAGTRSLTFWSAGCASGQEALSLAMLIHESFPQLRAWNLQILATDMSHQMVEKASSGRYRQHEVNRGLPARLLVRYFSQERNRWKASQEVLGMIRFFQHNLLDEWTVIPRVDLLFMRNILIYFDVETRVKMLAKVKRVLRKDGLLLLGTAETAFNIDDSYERVKIGRSVFYRLTKGGV